MNVEILVVMAVRVVAYELIVRGVAELNRVRCAWWIGWAQKLQLSRWVASDSPVHNIRHPECIVSNE